MAILIQFEKRIRPKSRQFVHPGDAKVLMFTGVRYQRDEDGARREQKINARHKRKAK